MLQWSKLVILVNGQVLTAPVVRAPVSHAVQITGDFDKAAAEKIAAAIESAHPDWSYPEPGTDAEEVTDLPPDTGANSGPGPVALEDEDVADAKQTDPDLAAIQTLGYRIRLNPLVSNGYDEEVFTKPWRPGFAPAPDAQEVRLQNSTFPLGLYVVHAETIPKDSGEHHHIRLKLTEDGIAWLRKVSGPPREWRHALIVDDEVVGLPVLRFSDGNVLVLEGDFDKAAATTIAQAITASHPDWSHPAPDTPAFTAHVDGLIESLANEKGGFVEHRTLQIMDTHATRALVLIGGPAVPQLMDALAHQNKHIRRHAAYILGKIGDKRALEALLSCCRAEHERNGATEFWDNDVMEPATFAVVKLLFPEQADDRETLFRYGGAVKQLTSGKSKDWFRPQDMEEIRKRLGNSLEAGTAHGAT